MLSTPHKPPHVFVLKVKTTLKPPKFQDQSKYPAGQI